MEPNEIRPCIEAILFAAGYPVKLETLMEVLEIGESELLGELDTLAGELSGRGIQLVRLGDTCQLCTRERYIDPIRAALGVRRGGNLSRSSMETLAIVAYHQPVTKSYIDQIRGIDSSYAVGNLTEKKLIEVCGRLDAPGRPSLYKTTEDFLRVFGLSDLSGLPPAELFGELAESVNSAGSKTESDPSSDKKEEVGPTQMTIEDMQ